MRNKEHLLEMWLMDWKLCQDVIRSTLPYSDVENMCIVYPEWYTVPARSRLHAEFMEEALDKLVYWLKVVDALYHDNERLKAENERLKQLLNEEVL